LRRCYPSPGVELAEAAQIKLRSSDGSRKQNEIGGICSTLRPPATITSPQKSRSCSESSRIHAGQLCWLPFQPDSGSVKSWPSVGSESTSLGTRSRWRRRIRTESSGRQKREAAVARSPLAHRLEKFSSGYAPKIANREDWHSIPKTCTTASSRRLVTNLGCQGSRGTPSVIRMRRSCTSPVSL